ncbi:TPA: hypothetical protein ACJY2T_000862 [Neisseria gonorrhoeae]
MPSERFSDGILFGVWAYNTENMTIRKQTMAQFFAVHPDNPQ